MNMYMYIKLIHFGCVGAATVWAATLLPFGKKIYIIAERVFSQFDSIHPIKIIQCKTFPIASASLKIPQGRWLNNTGSFAQNNAVLTTLLT